MDFSKAGSILKEIKNEVKKGIVGQEDLLDGLLIGILADGHLLIEGLPGLAKTRAVNLLAKSSAMQFKRLQFTPDLLPADIIGTRIYNQNSASFQTSLGPIFANFILADEINRAPAKVQSALLETMQEKQVTIADETHLVPRPFFVFATMNPVEQEGTYPLPEAQLDRFLMKLIVNYPTQDEEASIVKMLLNGTDLPPVDKIANAKDILDMQSVTREVFIEEKLIKYITDIVFATRFPEKFGLDLKDTIAIGASPRASISLAIASRAKALLSGRNSVLPSDIKAIAHGVLRHRIILSYQAEAESVKHDSIITKILEKIKVP